MYNTKELLNLLAMHFGKYNENSNIGKLFQTFLAGDTEFIKACEDMKKVVDLDQAKGKNLDFIHGVNKDFKRGDLNDVEYKKRLQLETKVNNSDGQISTVDETMTVLMGNAYDGIQETWKRSDYDNEPAGVIVRYRNLENEIAIETEENVDDPWFLDGEFNLDGQKLLNGGYNFDYSTYADQIRDTILNIKSYADRATASGVRTYFEEPIDIYNNIEIENYVNILVDSLTQNDINIQNSIETNVNILAENGPILLLDSSAILDGAYNLDAERDFIINSVEINEITA